MGILPVKTHTHANYSDPRSLWTVGQLFWIVFFFKTHNKQATHPPVCVTQKAKPYV